MCFFLFILGFLFVVVNFSEYGWECGLSVDRLKGSRLLELLMLIIVLISCMFLVLMRMINFLGFLLLGFLYLGL